jgi:hypothetical protein
MIAPLQGLSIVHPIPMSKFSDEIYKTITGFKASYKAASGLIAYIRFTFDTDGLGLTASDLMRGSFNTYISDTNLTTHGIKTYLSNSATVISGGVVFTSPSQALRYNQFNSYSCSITYYNTSYRYIHMLVKYDMVENVLSDLFIRNPKMLVGTIEVPLLSYGLYNYDAAVSTNSLITDSVYLSNALLTQKDYKDGFSDLFEDNFSDKTMLWDRLHTNHESGIKLYVSIVYDLTDILSSLSGSVAATDKFKMYSTDERINSLVGEVFLSDSNVNGTLGNYVQLTPNMSYSTYEAGMQKQMTGAATLTWSNPSSYPYLHIILNIFVDDVIDFYDIALADATLTIGGYTLSPMSNFAPYYAKTGSYVVIAPLDDSAINYNYLTTYVERNKWFGKSFVTYGDSITHYDGNVFNENHSESGQIAVGYQSYMRDKLCCTVTNRGSGGKTMSQIYGIINGATDLATFDAVTITSGANDHLQAVSLGAIAPVGSTFDTNTFYGALQAAIEKVLTVKPTIKIYLITPIPGFFDDTSYTYQNENKISIDFVNAIKAVGGLYSLPVCDWYSNVGINPLSKSYYLGDLPSVAYDLHPTQAGFARMAEILIPFLRDN